MNMHSFDVDIAVEYGVNAAILFQSIVWWCEHSKSNNTHYYDGFYWTYNSNKAYHEMFPYMSERQIGLALDKLVEAGLIVRGRYNKLPTDRTLWYAVTKVGYSKHQKCKMETAKMSNANVKNVEPIPVISTVISTVINQEDSNNSDVRNIYPEDSTNYTYCMERSDDHSMQAEKPAPIFRLMTNTGTYYEVYQTEVDKYKSLYPAVDIEQEYRKMVGWLESNSKRRKTMRGMPRFINDWLARAQDGASARMAGNQAKHSFDRSRDGSYRKMAATDNLI